MGEKTFAKLHIVRKKKVRLSTYKKSLYQNRKIKEGIFTVKHAVIYAVCCILGNMVAFGVITPIFSALFYGSDLNLTFLQALAATLGNTLVLVVVGIPILLVLANRYKSRTNLKEDKGDQY